MNGKETPRLEQSLLATLAEFEHGEDQDDPGHFQDELDRAKRGDLSSDQIKYLPAYEKHADLIIQNMIQAVQDRKTRNVTLHAVDEGDGLRNERLHIQPRREAPGVASKKKKMEREGGQHLQAHAAAEEPQPAPMKTRLSSRSHHPAPEVGDSSESGTEEDEGSVYSDKDAHRAQRSARTYSHAVPVRRSSRQRKPSDHLAGPGNHSGSSDNKSDNPEPKQNASRKSSRRLTASHNGDDDQAFGEDGEEDTSFRAVNPRTINSAEGAKLDMSNDDKHPQHNVKPKKIVRFLSPQVVESSSEQEEDVRPERIRRARGRRSTNAKTSGKKTSEHGNETDSSSLRAEVSFEDTGSRVRRRQQVARDFATAGDPAHGASEDIETTDQVTAKSTGDPAKVSHGVFEAEGEGQELVVGSLAESQAQELPSSRTKQCHRQQGEQDPAASPGKNYQPWKVSSTDSQGYHDLLPTGLAVANRRKVPGRAEPSRQSFSRFDQHRRTNKSDEAESTARTQESPESNEGAASTYEDNPDHEASAVPDVEAQPPPQDVGKAGGYRTRTLRSGRSEY